MIEVPEFLKRAADKCGFVRETFQEDNIPTIPSNITVLPFFGDLKTSFVLSSLLLKRYREEKKGSRYFVLCSWPGHRFLFPYVDEYWSISDPNVNHFYSSAVGFDNNADMAVVYVRKLNQFFDDVIDVGQFKEYYECGLTDEFKNNFGHVERFLPMVQSSSSLGTEFNKKMTNRVGYKILVCPTTVANSWREHPTSSPIKEDFWVALIERLIKEGYVPVIVQNYSTYDLSSRFAQQCLYVADHDLSKIACTMRSVDCVLDFFSGFSRIAIAARAPFLALNERNKYIKTKEYELDDLCCDDDLPRQYIFSFTTILEAGNPALWNVNIFDSVIARLNTFLPTIDRDALPTGSEITERVPYKKVRKREAKRLGLKFIKVEQD